MKERSITEPTAIQKLIIPHLLSGKSAIFRSATGTGKTFAYLLPALQSIEDLSPADRYGGIHTLVCAPTFELCSQIKAEVEFLSAVPSALIIGSVRVDRQIENLKKINPVIVVGNPGRILALVKMRKLKLYGLRFLILDEADRLTAGECLEETIELLSIIERNVKRRTMPPETISQTNFPEQSDTPESKSLCLAACSATVSEKTRTKLGTLFKSVEIIENDEHEILRERIEHWAFFSEKRRKVQTLRSLFAALRTKKSRLKALVFTSRNDEAGKILSQLQHHKISSSGLFGKKELNPDSRERKESLDLFRQGKVEVLVSTDLAARGLDIPNITHIIALDVPGDKEIYIHRSGRTGRAGRRGVMVTIGDETQMHLLASLEKKLKIKVQPKELYYGRICDPQPL
jgi:superfamily II DNA/RNA helicase